MAGRTISAGYTGGITLAAADNPLTVTATGSVGSIDAAALATVGTADWVIGNAGTIAAAGISKASVGILLAGSGASTISNQAGAAISGGQFGIYGLKAATLANAGAISATGAATAVGVVLGTGAVANAGTILGSRYGTYFIGTGTVSNTGSISGTTNAGVVLNGGGRVENTGPAAQITGQRLGVYLFAGGSVSNTGSIGATGTAGYGALLKAGGTLDNGAGGTISGGRAGVIATGTVVSPLNNAGALSGGTYGAGIAGAAASFTNAAGGAITGGVVGVLATSGGGVGNAGNIIGRFGVLVTTAVGVVTNSGSVASAGKSSGQAPEAVGAGIQLRAGGTIVNEAGGRISGYWIGAQVGSFNGNNANGGAVLNAGVITANDPGRSIGAAVWFKGEGRISNAASGTIAGGPFGIVSYNKVTIANRGLISGEPHAVFTSVAGNGSRIIVYPGATFQGTVRGDAATAAAPTGVLELAAGAGTGTIAGFGAKYLGFGRVEVAAGATWSLAGTVDSGQTVALAGPGAALVLVDPPAVAGVISGFNATTALVLGDVGNVTAAALGAQNVLTLTRAGGGTIALRLDPAQVFAPGSFGFAASGGNTVLSAPCFAQGTRIATAAGEMRVEELAPGMQVLRAGGGAAEVVWVGHRRVDCTRHPRPDEVWPVRIQAGAFARGVPGRDLLLSPDHAVFWEGVLIPVRHLVNGRTVRQEAVDAVTYFHVELAAHDVLLAERLACESYLDTGNRAAFANGGAATMLHPEFARGRWAAAGCAPLVEAGPAVASARSRLLARAGAMGLRRGSDPQLVVRADGVALTASASGARREVALPEGVRAVALESRCWVPAQMGGGEDARRLGVAVGRVLLDGVVAPDSCFGAGWHAAEGAWRWSDGCGWLHSRGARRISFDLATGGVYWAA